MPRSSWVIALCSVMAVGAAKADPAAPSEEDPVAISETVSASAPPVRLRRNLPVTALESALVLGGFNLGARALGKDYVRISFDSIATNLRSDWVWDEDAFSTNQFGHPYMGSLYYAAARSNGFGVVGSSLVTYIDSMLWELFMETETPSLNDQLITPAAGILLGEILHKWSRSILWRPDGGRPNVMRRTIAFVLDPMGMVNRATLGPSWSLTKPPPSFGWIGLGWSGRDFAFDATASSPSARANFLYGSLAYTYGLPTSQHYQPSQPLDHFDVRLDGFASRDRAYAVLRMRGLLYGRAFGGPDLRGLWGAFGSYDFENPERLRISTLGLGVGTLIHAPLGDRAFFQGSGLANVIPYGTAGGGLPGLPNDGLDRDYHRGPGASLHAELKLGWRGRGLIRLATHVYQIDGTPFDEGNELVALSRLGIMVGLARNHAIAVEAGGTLRRARFEDAPDIVDRSAQLRVFYALIPDLDFGGSAQD